MASQSKRSAKNAAQGIPNAKQAHVSKRILQWLKVPVYEIRRGLRRAPLLGPYLIHSRIKRDYERKMKRPLRIAPPATFNDHMVYRILYDRDPKLKIACDKIAVRDMIRERVGESFVVPLLGAWADPRDIPWDDLPERVILKPNHSSGRFALVRREMISERAAIAARAAEWVRWDYFETSLEWGYRDLPRRITAEPLLLGPGGGPLVEASALTFGGKFAALRIFTGAKRSSARRDNWFDRSGKRLAFHSLNYEPGDYVLDPDEAARMVAAAETVSAGFAQLRVDFYITSDGLRIGELTPYFGAGKTPWSRPGCGNLFGQFWKDPSLIDRITDMNQALADAD